MSPLYYYKVEIRIQRILYCRARHRMALRCLRHRKKFGYRKKIRYSWRKSVSVPVSVWEHRIATENRKKGRYKTMYILYNIFKPRSSEDAYAFGMKSKFQELCINKKISFEWVEQIFKSQSKNWSFHEKGGKECICHRSASFNHVK